MTEAAEDPDLDNVEDEDDDEMPAIWRVVHEDPWGRWLAGEEPVRELDVLAIDADASGILLVRSARIEIAPGVISDPRMPTRGSDEYDGFDLHFRGRWNAAWRGSRLTDLSLDLFSGQWPEMLRLVFEVDQPVDLLAAYHASFPGLWGLTLCNLDTKERNARDEPLGHSVFCRDPRLALRIAARYPGVASHGAGMQAALWGPKPPETDEGRGWTERLEASARAVEEEPVPGARAVMDADLRQTFSTLLSGEREPAPTINDPFASSMGIYTLVAASGLPELANATLLRADRGMLAGLAAHVTFPDAIAAIRDSETERLPMWIDFCDSEGQPLLRRQSAGIDQPLYGALIDHDDSGEDSPEPFHSVMLVGRTSGLIQEPLPFCALGIGPDDAWRFPIEEGQISLLNAHSGGVTVQTAHLDDEYEIADPPITQREFAHEVSRSLQRQTEWALARIGAALTALKDGLLLLERAETGVFTFDLVRAPAPAEVTRSATMPDAITIAQRLRELGSLHRVAKVDGIDSAAAYDALERAGIDADQVLRDEVLLRWRRTASVEAVISSTHLQRDLIERYLREAGIDSDDTPIPHDVTDPDVLAAIAAYREAGTLEAAGERLGISGESVRRRIARAGLAVDEIRTASDQRLAAETVDAWERAGRSLAGAARELRIDPRTVRERLRRAGIPAAVLAGDQAHQLAEARGLLEQTGSQAAVAALMSVSPTTLRRWLAVDETPPEPGTAGRPRISDAELRRALAAHAEYGSVRAAARALGMSVGGLSHRLKLARSSGLDETISTARDRPAEGAA
jgi:molybdenum-dependent DNA-binding transcriptional regulator ModE